MTFLELVEKLKEEKRLLNNIGSTDYKALKFVDGELSEEEYTPTKAYRKELRKQINKLRDR